MEKLRLNKHTFAYLTILPNMTPKIAIINAVPAKTKLQFGLRFLALGSLCRLNTDLYSIGNLTNGPNDIWTTNQLDHGSTGLKDKWTSRKMNRLSSGLHDKWTTTGPH